MSNEVYQIVRTIHVLAAVAWFGEVVVINFVLIPVLSRYRGKERKEFLNTIFPRIFNLASVLSATSAITGVVLLYGHIGFDLTKLVDRGAWGWSIMIGGGLGFILTTFHFFIENHLAKRVGVGDPNISQEDVEDVHLKLKIIPRIGMVVITIIVVMMMNATRGFIPLG